MKRFVFIIINALIPILGVAQSNRSHFVLTAQDKIDYTLSIDQLQIGKLSDTGYYRKHHGVIWIKVKLSNHSNDTLKYINMTCGTNEIYITSSKDIVNQGWPCEANYPEKVKLPPHSSSILSMPFFFDKTRQNNYSFKIGMYLCKYKSPQSWNDFIEDFFIHQNRPNNCVIWSNEVRVSL